MLHGRASCQAEEGPSAAGGAARKASAPPRPQRSGPSHLWRYAESRAHHAAVVATSQGYTSARG
eukprot:scaffold92320_cov60-Phaeocystis_antarctica.AAC.4